MDQRRFRKDGDNSPPSTPGSDTNKSTRDDSEELSEPQEDDDTDVEGKIQCRCVRIASNVSRTYTVAGASKDNEKRPPERARARGYNSGWTERSRKTEECR